MPPADSAATLAPESLRPSPTVGAFRLSALEKDPRVVSFAQTRAGKAALIVPFAVLAWLVHKPAAIVGAALVVFFPARRRLMVALASLAMLLVTSRLEEVLRAVGQQGGALALSQHFAFKPAALLLALVLVIGYVHVAKTRLPALLLRWPVTTLLAINTGLVALASLLPLHGAWRTVAWAVVAGAGGYLWYAAYGLRDRTERHGRTLLKDASAWRPFWGGTNVPFPKPGAWLEQLEVRTPEEAAVWQLKALKLLGWALVLAVLRTGLVVLATGKSSHPSAWLPDDVLAVTVGLSFAGSGLEVPTLPDALAVAFAGNPNPAAVNWASLALYLAVDLLDISIFGHVAVAGARMAGFKALRNTHRPLESRSIADFWNRYYFYFKELLLDFFFFPTYMRWFKKHPRLRLFFATFVAAGLGNFLYHWLADPAGIVTWGFWGSLRAMETYALYAAILVLGIGLSQLAKPRAAVRTSTFSRVTTVAGVLLFYGLLQVPNVAPLGSTTVDCLRFFLCLFPQL